MSSPLGAPFPGCNCPVCGQARQSPGVWMHSQCALLQEHLQPQPPMLPKEIVAAPVEGWRIWEVYPSVSYSAERLGSVGIGPVRWDRVERARCYNRNPLAIQPHSAPFELCGCGLWAFKDDSRVEETLRQYAPPTGAVHGYGRVQLWGKIIECEHGWRGAYARPLQVTLLGADDKTAAAIHAFYGCVVIVEDVPEWLRAERSAYSQMRMQKGQWRWNAPLQQWVSSTPGVSPIPVPMPVPLKRRRPSFGAMACLVAAGVNTMFACLGVFFWNHSAWSWGTNAVVALAGLIVCCLSWNTP